MIQSAVCILQSATKLTVARQRRYFTGLPYNSRSDSLKSTPGHRKQFLKELVEDNRLNYYFKISMRINKVGNAFDFDSFYIEA